MSCDACTSIARFHKNDRYSLDEAVKASSITLLSVNQTRDAERTPADRRYREFLTTNFLQAQLLLSRIKICLASYLKIYLTSE